MTTDIIIPEPLRAKARELALPDSLAGDLLAAAAKQKQDEDRAAVIRRIAADLAALKKDGKISSMSALAECIVSGGLRGVIVDWEAA